MSARDDSGRPDVDMAQVPFEFDQLLALVEHTKPRCILEIGVWEGGTLWHWLSTGADVAAIDDTMRAPGPDEWHRWAENATGDLKLIQGRSSDRQVIDRARFLGPYDFVFIDADHTYDAVKADWDNYRPMVAPGGIVAFHDILPRPEYGVHQLWQEVKAEYPTVEIVEGSRPGYCGIGVAWLP